MKNEQKQEIKVEKNKTTEEVNDGPLFSDVEDLSESDFRLLFGKIDQDDKKKGSSPIKLAINKKKRKNSNASITNFIKKRDEKAHEKQNESIEMIRIEAEEVFGVKSQPLKIDKIFESDFKYWDNLPKHTQ
jgi:hypothetical protein